MNGIIMSDEFKNRHVGTVAAIIGSIVFLAAFTGLLLNL